MGDFGVSFDEDSPPFGLRGLGAGAGDLLSGPRVLGAVVFLPWGKGALHSSVTAAETAECRRKQLSPLIVFRMNPFE